jgi:hypothetical protein
MRTLMKLAGLPPKYYQAINSEDFLAQARSFEDMEADKLSLLAKWLSTVGATHPWTVMRAKQLLEWVDGGAYEQVFKAPREVAFQRPPGVQGFCPQCGRPLRGGEAFCPGCGRPCAAAAGV